MEELALCPICESSEFDLKLESRDYFLTQETFRVVTCSNCSLSFTNPRPTKSELGKYYQSDQYISHSNKANSITNVLYKLVRNFTLWQKFNMLSKSLQNRSQIDHLDYGCGTGHFIEYTTKKGWKSIGYEPDSRANNQSNSLIINDISQISSLESFDVITLFHVLEHVYDLNETLELLISKLRPNGVLLLALPNLESYDAKHYNQHWAGYDLPRHLYHFNQTSVQRLSVKHGIKIDSTVPMIFDSFYVSILSEKYKKSNFPFLKGMLKGLQSNLKAGSKMEHSSLIYILRK
jgi:SAM-dependent methyltransferase